MTFAVPTTSFASEILLWFYPVPLRLGISFLSHTDALVNSKKKDSSRLGETCAVGQPAWFESQFWHLAAVTLSLSSPSHCSLFCIIVVKGGLLPPLGLQGGLIADCARWLTWCLVPWYCHNWEENLGKVFLGASVCSLGVPNPCPDCPVGL